MTDLLDQLEQRAHRVDRGDPRAIFRAAVSEADEVRSLQVADDRARTRDRRPQRVALAALVACVALVAVGIVWIADREPSPPVADAFPAADVRFGPLAPPEGYELSGVRKAMYGPMPEVRVMTTVYAPDVAATSSITVLVRRGVPFTPDGMMPIAAPTERIGGHEVRFAEEDNNRSGAIIAGWDRVDGSRVFVIGRGVGADDVRRSIPELAIDDHDLATVAVLPEGFERRFAGDGTGSMFATTGSETYILQFAPTDGSERQISIDTVPGADFEPLALRWADPSVEAFVLPDGTPAFRASDGRAWIKELPDGLAVVHGYQVEPSDDLAGLIARVRPLTPTEWDDLIGDEEVVVGLVTTGPSIEAVGTTLGWRTEPAE